MKMRSVTGVPVLCSMLLGLASAGSAAAIPSSVTADSGESQARNGASRFAHDARLHARVQAIRAAMREARASRQPSGGPSARWPIAWNRRRVTWSRTHRATPSTEAVVHVLLADIYSGADALRSASKPTRTVGLARIDGALHAVRSALRSPLDSDGRPRTGPGLNRCDCTIGPDSGMLRPRANRDPDPLGPKALFGSGHEPELNP